MINVIKESQINIKKELEEYNNILKQEEENCINCLDDEKVCTECQIETKLYQGKCANKYCNNYPNCNYCIEELGCVECQNGYEVKNKFCSIKKKMKRKMKKK